MDGGVALEEARRLTVAEFSEDVTRGDTPDRVAGPFPKVDDGVGETDGGRLEVGGGALAEVVVAMIEVVIFVVDVVRRRY